MNRSITLSQANQLIEIALKTGRELQTAPLTVAILDAGGHLKALQREDESSLMRPSVAIGKAWGALSMGTSSRALGAAAAERPAFVAALTTMAEGKLVPVPGGVLIRDQNNEIIGAVGITGDTSDRDEACAIAAIEALSFRTQL